MRNLLFTFFLLLPFSLQAVTLGSASFTKEEGDTLGFIKEQLEYLAMRDVISQELNEMGLDKDLFWIKYESKFDQAFLPVEEALKKRFDIENKPQNIKSYNEVLRSKRLKSLRNFINLKRIVKQYAVARMSRSSTNTNRRFIKIEATVIDRELLRKYYYRYVSGKKTSEYGTLYLNVKYELQNCEYSDLGVEDEGLFKKTLNDYWLAWFMKPENKAKNISSVVVMDKTLQQKYEEFNNLPIDRVMSEVPEVFLSALILDVVINIEKKSYDETFKEFEFEFSGGLVVQELQSNRFINHDRFVLETHTYKPNTKKDLQDAIANHIYRYPMSSYLKTKKSIQNISPVTLTKIVDFKDYPNLNTVRKIITQIESKGVKYSLSTQLHSIKNKTVSYVFFLDGNLAQLQELLAIISREKTYGKLEIVDSSELFGIKFINNEVSDFSNL